jgi:predicted RNase H-like nuclease (RuvC/YqgF family)
MVIEKGWEEKGLSTLSEKGSTIDAKSTLKFGGVFTTVKNKIIEYYIGVFLTVIAGVSGAGIYQANKVVLEVEQYSKTVIQVQQSSNMLAGEAKRLEGIIVELKSFEGIAEKLNIEINILSKDLNQLKNNISLYSSKFWDSHLMLATKDEEQKRKLFELETRVSHVLSQVNNIDKKFEDATKYAGLFQLSNSQLVKELNRLNSVLSSSQLQPININQSTALKNN